MDIIKSIKSVLFSNQTTLVALLIFATSMAYATFLENDYGTPAVWALVYDAWWFELVMAILAINFLGNIVKYRLWRKEKWAVCLFHLAFVITILGAFVTRYTGYEGTMSIREGQASNVMLSNDMYFQSLVKEGEEIVKKEERLQLSSLTTPDFDINIGTKSKPLWAKCVSYTPDAEEALVKGDQAVVALAITNGGERRDIFIIEGDSYYNGQTSIGLNTNMIEGLNLRLEGDSLYLQANDTTAYLEMASQLAGQIPPGERFTVKTNTLYHIGQTSFVLKATFQNVALAYQPTKDKNKAASLPDIMELEISTDNESKRYEIYAEKGVMSVPTAINVGGVKAQILFGPRVSELPFSLHLRDFQLERYPGSMSPSSYASEVTVMDGEKEMPYRIFMNNVLDYKGYRFFQASYDLDEGGTILSINKDYWGTWITYIGYTLMGIGMFFALFGKTTRFQHLNRELARLKERKKSLLLVLLLLGNVGLWAQDKAIDLDTSQILLPVEANHGAAFGALLIQDMDGRIKPVNSLASELCRKLMRSTSFESPANGAIFDVNQLFLALHKDPDVWQFIPLVKVDAEKSLPILEKIDKPDAKRLSFRDFFDTDGQYILIEEVDAANKKKPAERNAFDKETLALDERFNLLYQALSGSYLKLFPKKDDPNHNWYSNKFQKAGFSAEDSLFVRRIMPEYYASIDRAQASGDWTEAMKNLDYINTYQQIIGAEVIPTPKRVAAELWYNELGLFNKLFPIYWLLGTLLLVLAVLRVFFYENKGLKYTYAAFTVLIGLGFIAHTFNIALRWYAGDYPPWSNGYEMTILVSWFLVLFGLMFMRKTDFVVPLAVLFSGTLMFVAFLDWLNPEITNLVPVLKSYWLKIHVATIVASYAPLGLCALLGITSLLLMIARGSKQHQSMGVAIRELTTLNEMSMTIGLYLLAIGTFLGGVWANESWGRYWAWDPKETWALISIIVYTAVLHLRLVPAMRGDYVFSVSSVIAFFSIIMTSFGVNYYLSGLHSYAQGDPMPIPTFIYVLVISIVILIIAAYWRMSARSKQKITN